MYIKNMKKKPLSLLKEVFGTKEGQSLKEFRDECNELKSHANYEEFLQEVAEFAGVTLDLG